MGTREQIEALVEEDLRDLRGEKPNKLVIGWERHLEVVRRMLVAPREEQFNAMFPSHGPPVLGWVVAEVESTPVGRVACIYCPEFGSQGAAWYLAVLGNREGNFLLPNTETGEMWTLVAEWPRYRKFDFLPTPTPTRAGCPKLEGFFW